MIVKPLSVYIRPAISGFFKAWLTLGAADWNDLAEVKCGHCAAEFEQKIHSSANWVGCPCCGAKNVW